MWKIAIELFYSLEEVSYWDFDFSNSTVSKLTKIGICPSNSTSINLTKIGLSTVILLVVTLLVKSSFDRTGGSNTYISNLDFLLLWVSTVLPYSLPYSESESLESLYSWWHFILRKLFWVFLTAFLSFKKCSIICTKELAWSFLPLPWHFCPMAAF